MNNTRYRLGNQAKEYELVTKYLGWLPYGFPDWESWLKSEDEKKYSKELPEILTKQPPLHLTIYSPDKEQYIELLMDRVIGKSAFPSSIYSEESANDWWRFYIVALQEKPDEQFIIPLY